MRMQEQAADLAGAFQIGAQRQRLVAEDPPQLLALLREGRDSVAVERTVAPDLAEDLAGAADGAALEILEHEQIQIVELALAFAREPFRRFAELVLQRLLVGGQVGEAAAGQLRHLVERVEIVFAGGADAKTHAAPPAIRRIVSADKAARSARLSTIRYSSMLWILPPRTPMV